MSHKTVLNIGCNKDCNTVTIKWVFFTATVHFVLRFSYLTIILCMKISVSGTSSISLTNIFLKSRDQGSKCIQRMAIVKLTNAFSSVVKHDFLKSISQIPKYRGLWKCWQLSLYIVLHLLWCRSQHSTCTQQGLRETWDTTHYVKWPHAQN
jgi:hypothetical protein